MLRPKESADGGVDEPLSVTVINREELPSFSTERFFMLSEFELNSHSVRFIPDLQDQDECTPETIDSASTDEVELNSYTEADAFPPYLLVYVLWRPNMTTSVSAFTANVIMEILNKIQTMVDVSLSDEDKKRTRDGGGPMSPSRFQNDPEFDTSPVREQESVSNSSLSSLDNGKTRLYLVVDRITPYKETTIDAIDDEKGNQRQRLFEVETKLAESLARYVATNSRLRSFFQGITVGVADHERAAPGLDACLDAINCGAKDRRTVGRDCKSHVGIIALSSDDLLGLDEEQETDAAQGILQTRISTEWNGKGNLKSFALRAHSMWRKDYGLPPEPSEFLVDAKKQRRTGRRLSRLDEELERLDKFPLDTLLNFGAFFLIVYYVWNGLFGEASSHVR